MIATEWGFLCCSVCRDGSNEHSFNQSSVSYVVLLQTNWKTCLKISLSMSEREQLRSSSFRGRRLDCNTETWLTCEIIHRSNTISSLTHVR